MVSLSLPSYSRLVIYSTSYPWSQFQILISHYNFLGIIICHFCRTICHIDVVSNQWPSNLQTLHYQCLEHAKKIVTNQGKNYPNLEFARSGSFVYLVTHSSSTTVICSNSLGPVVLAWTLASKHWNKSSTHANTYMTWPLIHTWNLSLVYMQFTMCVMGNTTPLGLLWFSWSHLLIIR